MNPNRRTCPATGVSSGVTFTSGLPALAITNGSVQVKGVGCPHPFHTQVI